MADPRLTGPQVRQNNHSPLMRALAKANKGDVVNFCPFGCSDLNLDDLGQCGHLVGFYNGGKTYEPRMVRKKDRRVIVNGRMRRPMEQGFKLVQITTSARVYSPALVKELIPQKDTDFDEGQQAMMTMERQLLEAADRIRNPVLEGDWGETAYDFTKKE